MTTDIPGHPREGAEPPRPAPDSGDGATTRPLGRAWQLAPTGLAVVDSHGVLVAANEAFGRVVGHGVTGALDGIELSTLLAPGDADRLLAGEVDPSAVPVSGVGSDGMPFLALMEAAAVEGETVVTAQTRRPAITAGPVDASPGGGDLGHVLSHDLRGRLRAVRGFLDLFSARYSDTGTDDGDAVLHRAALASQVADQMTEAIVRYIRLEEGTFSLAPTPLLDVVEKALAIVAEPLDIVIDDLPTVMADAPLLADALAELLVNAARFAEEDRPPAVTVSATSSGRWCTLHVTDNGRGVPTGQAEAAFELGRQLQSRNWETGIGMGLPICRRIIDGHGGTIHLRDGLSRGCTVDIRLVLGPEP